MLVTPLASATRSDSGAKAARLAELLRGGLPVPEGFSIGLESYRRHLAAVAPRFDDLTADEIRARILGSRISGELAIDLALACRPIFLAGAAVAVRSSSNAEDMSGASFAGLYESVLQVRSHDDLLDSVLRCWASYWGREAVCYREQFGVRHGDHGMAVLVQRMIEPAFSGVLFTSSPLSENRDEYVVEMIAGIGERLVQGEVRARRLFLSRAGRPLRGDGQHLPAALLRRLARLGSEIEQRLGGPQDIEWAADGEGRLWILQARPITRTGEVALEPGWVKAYDDRYSPMGCELAVQRHRTWVEAINRYHKTAFRPQVRSADGWVYFRAPWRSPGLSTRAWMHVWALAGWLRRRRVLEEYREGKARRTEWLRKSEAALPDLDLPGQIALLRSAVESYLDLQASSYPAVEAAKTSAAMLERLLRAWLPNEPLLLQRLLSGLDNESLRRDLKLQHIGGLLARCLGGEDTSGFDYTSLLALRSRSDDGRRFWSEFDAYLAEYGYVWADRYPRDPAWKLDRTRAVQALLSAAASPESLEQSAARTRADRLDAIALVRRALSARRLGAIRVRIFDAVLRAADSAFPEKENRNHEVYRSVMLIRKISLAIGRSLTLDPEDDVFYLTPAELADAQASRPQVAARKRAYMRSSPGRAASRATGAANLAGEPCSPGVATGRACVLERFGQLGEVRPGDILVCRDLRPAWSTVFHRAAGVVSENGSLLSHGATLAREYGVAAVMNVAGATGAIRTGDELTIDGRAGTIHIRRIAAARS
jgi:pyruvate,water dikinase